MMMMTMMSMTMSRLRIELGRRCSRGRGETVKRKVANGGRGGCEVGHEVVHKWPLGQGCERGCGGGGASTSDFHLVLLATHPRRRWAAS